MGAFENLNSRYKGFKLNKIVPLPELKCTLRELTHEHSGAEVLHIETNDPENVFCLSFQTLPPKSNGVAHILEHTVLCGSKKYPIKDPFFAMSRRSLNTFMNALTGSDFTCYPAATQIPHDFYNLLDVYMDAVFHPYLKELSFKQEGHRLEFEIPDQPDSPLVIRGIVYNEMKGAMNSSAARMQEALNHALFPDVTYGINSGGDPAEIPSLTYDELLQFHRTHYHPSRCLFYFYGNLPLANHLDFIEERILRNTDKIPPLPPIPLQTRFTYPKRVEGKYPAALHEAFEDKALISFGFLTCSIREQETCLALSILEIILLDTDASPLKKALLKSRLCKQVSSYMETEMNEIPFTIHLRGCKPENASAIEELILGTLQSIVDNGIPHEMIENAIHQLQFYRSEITGDSHPFGFTLFFRSGLLKQHGGESENGLLIHTLFEKIRTKCIQNPHYLTDLITRYLLDNTHRVRVTLVPDTDLEKQELLEERKRLEEIHSHLNPQEKRALVNSAQELKAFQQAQEKEDREVLPKISVDDIPKSAPLLPLSQGNWNGVATWHHSCFTNEIGYADLFFDLSPLNDRELMVLRFMTILLYQIGCGGKPYEETLQCIQANTGGITPYLTIHIQVDDVDRFQPAFVLRGKALYRKLPQLFPLLSDLIVSPDFADRDRLREILHKHHSGLESGLTQNALKYAINLSASNLHYSSYIANLWFGLDYYHMIDGFAKNFDAQAEEVAHILYSLKDRLNRASFDLVLSSDEEEYLRLKNHEFYGLKIPSAGSPLEAWNQNLPLLAKEPQGRIIPSPVAFIAKVFRTIPYAHPDAPALNIAQFLFDNLVLHRKIREVGGAYGSGSVTDGAGNFYFYSYRDPYIASSLLAFEEAIRHVQSGQFDARDLEEAKLEMIQRLDNPPAPGSRAVIAYHWHREGKTEEVRQNFRTRLLAATADDVSRAVAEHIAPHYSSGTTVVFAGDALLAKENAKLKDLGFGPLNIKDLCSR
jgi:Zn-dependent M16 (insulinase) family peptidase